MFNFGSQPSNVQPVPLFNPGQSMPPPQQSNFQSGFGGMTNSTSNPPNLFASSQPSMFGANQAQPQLQLQPQGQPFSSCTILPTIAQPVTGIPFPKETKFTDLPQELKNNLECIERTLRIASEQSATLKTQSYNDTNSLTIDIGQLTDRILSCETTNENCRGQVLSAKRVLNQYWKYGESVARMIIASRQTGPDNQIKWVPIITPADFNLIEEMVVRLESQVVELVDTTLALSQQLDQLYNQSSSSRFNVDILRSTLRHQHDLFMGLASKVATLQEDLDRLKSFFKNFLAKHRGDLRDPFVGGSRTLTNSTDSFAQQAKVKPLEPSAVHPNPPSIFTSSRPAYTAAAPLYPNSALPPLTSNPLNLSSNNPISTNNIMAKRLSLPGSQQQQVTQTPNPFLQTPR